MSDNSYVFEVTPQNFQTDVIERSRQMPVLVLFWAAQMAPSVQMRQMLEKMVAQFQGKVLLALARGKRVVLVGPGTPLSPTLFACGIERLAGLVVDDPDLAARVVMEGGAVRGLRPAGRNLTIAHPGAAPPPPDRPAG